MAASAVFGTYTGTGAAINIELGFVPARVEIFNETDGDVHWEWQTGMTAGHAMQIAADGTSTRITSNGVTTRSPTDFTSKQGFTVGTTLSESAKVHRYIAWRPADY